MGFPQNDVISSVFMRACDCSRVDKKPMTYLKRQPITIMLTVRHDSLFVSDYFTCVGVIALIEREVTFAGTYMAQRNNKYHKEEEFRFARMLNLSWPNETVFIVTRSANRA